MKGKVSYSTFFSFNLKAFSTWESKTFQTVFCSYIENFFLVILSVKYTKVDLDQ